MLLSLYSPSLVNVVSEWPLIAGAKADAYNDILGKCPIHIAIELESKSSLIALLDCCQGNRANIDTLDQSGRTALHLACEKGWFKKNTYP